MAKNLNAGKLRAFVEVLHYTDNEWKPIFTAYGAYKRIQRVIYSRHTVAVPGAQFLMRETGIDRTMAIRYDGKLHLVTEVEPVERGYIHVTAAEVKPRLLFGTRKLHKAGSLNRPIVYDEKITPFWGVVAEKYTRGTQQEPQYEIGTTLILTTPKKLILRPGDQLTLTGQRYNCHFEPSDSNVIPNGDTDFRVQYSYADTSEFVFDYEIYREVEA